MVHAVEFFFDAYDFLHDFYALVVLAAFGENLAFGVELAEFLSED